MPDPLIINHGSKGNVKILPDLFSEPIFDIQTVKLKILHQGKEREVMVKLEKAPKNLL